MYLPMGLPFSLLYHPVSRIGQYHGGFPRPGRTEVEEQESAHRTDVRTFQH